MVRKFNNNWFTRLVAVLSFGAMSVIAVPTATAQIEPFVVADIRVEGLQRIAPGSVFAALPVSVGDVVDGASVRSISRNLFYTGNFDDISVGRDGNVLVLTVAERPSISEITIDGNKAIETEALLDGLKGAGLAVGQVFQRSTLDGMQLELLRQYVIQGRYDANIDTEVIPEPRNRVSISIDIDEGTVSKIKHINIVGNDIFDDETLLDIFELQVGGMFSFFSSADKYSKEKLESDLETLTSYYQDRGYLQFEIESTQVAVSPAKDAVYITANVVEGDRFTVTGVDFSGDLVLPEADLSRFLLVAPGQVFSQQLVTSTEEYLTRRLGNEGYNFAKVTGMPEVGDGDAEVSIKFFIDPGRRTYVRRINFEGNDRTADNVLRREMRQMEAAPASSAAIEQSRVRLQRLGFFSSAEVETVEIPGYDDLIDLDFTVEEQSFGSIGGSLGYSQFAGLIVGLNLQQNNFLGSGRQVGVNLNTSKWQSIASLNYNNPYFTEDGVSRGFSVFYRKSDLSEINVASYTTNTVGATMSFGYPVSEIERLGFNLGITDTDITSGRYAVQEIRTSPRLIDGVDQYFIPTRLPDGTFSGPEVLLPVSDLPPSAFTEIASDGFLDKNGDSFTNLSVTGSWLRSTLNRGQLATRGTSQSLSAQISVPGSDLEFFKLNYRGEMYIPLYREFTFHLRGELGYGDGFGDTTELPFYEHFFSGGFGSVRGFETNTLGPRSTPPVLYQTGVATTGVDENGLPTEVGGPDGRGFGYIIDPETGKIATQQVFLGRRADPFGGNVLIEGSAEILFPMPFVKDRRSIRSAFFLDAGNVFNTNCRANQINCFGIDAGELRYSVGIGVTWLSGFGPLTFALARPLNASETDRREVFQFTLGRGF
ncbi:MAG TPA: outer membrane protein assembly factor BamA [Halieaceae bacterium]|nr:outer membrane protein assembly factor BamA [Halieaceae bacterium]